MRENQPTTPITPYGVSKLAAEKYCQAFFRAYGLPTVSLRYFNVYGERQSANPYSGVIAIFAKALLHERTPSIYGDGRQTRDFIHVSDVVRANLLALESKRGLGETFNVGTQRATSINQLYRLLARLSDKEETHPIFKPKRIGDPRNSCADISKARSLLRFKPLVELEPGLESLLTWLKSG